MLSNHIERIESEHKKWAGLSLTWWMRSWELKGIDKQIAELKSKKYNQKALKKTNELVNFLEKIKNGIT